MYTVEQLEMLLKRAGADFELIRQGAPILSARDAEPYYDIAKAAPTLVLRSDRAWWPASFRRTGEGWTWRL